MGAVLVEQRSALATGFALPRHRAVGTGFGENDRIAGGCGNSLHEVRNFSLGFAVAPRCGQADIGLMATGYAGKAAIACLHIVQFERYRHQAIKKATVAVAVKTLPTVAWAYKVRWAACALTAAM